MLPSSSLPSALLRSICQRARVSALLLLSPSTSLPHIRCISSSFYTTEPPVQRKRTTTSPPPPLPPSSSPFPPLLPPTNGAESPPPSAVHPFAHLPRPPPLLDLLNSAVSRSLKSRISPSLRSPPQSSSKSSLRKSHSTNPVHRHTHRIKGLAVAQLTALHSSLSGPLSQYLRAFPPVSHLSGFDRAVMRLSLKGGEGEYVKVLRGVKRVIAALNSAYERGVKEVTASHINTRAPPPPPPYDLSAAITSPSPPTSPTSRDMDTLLSYHRGLLLHTVASASSLYLELLGLVGRLSHLPVVRVDGVGLTVLVLGVPNVGKSSLLRAISSGKPEVQNYAFTTRGLVVGHLMLREEEGMEEAVMEPLPPPETRESRGSQTSARRPRFAALNTDEDTRAVLLHERRTAAAAQVAEEEQSARVKASYLSSVSSSSPSVPVQLIDTPGLLFRPDVHRKAIELLTLTSLHHLPLHLIVFVVDESGSCGWDVREQESVRREVRTRYQRQLEGGRVGWIDVRSKSDITEIYDARGQATGEVDGEGQGGWDEEEEKKRRQEMESHRQLYGVQEGEGSVTESTCKVAVSIHEPQSLARLQKEIRQQLRAQMRRMREERGEVYESIEDEFKRTFAVPPLHPPPTLTEESTQSHLHATQ